MTAALQIDGQRFPGIRRERKPVLAAALAAHDQLAGAPSWAILAQDLDTLAIRTR